MLLGSPTAPVLAVMPFAPEEGMTAWFYERLRECGILSTDVCTLYMLHEPPENSGGRPSARQLRESTARVAEEMKGLSPKVVVPFGGDALYFTTGLDIGIADARGYLIRPELRGTFVYDEWGKVGEYKRADKKKDRQVGDPRMGWVKRASKGLLPESFTGFVIPSYELESIRLQAFTPGAALKADMMRVKRALNGSLKIVDEGFTFFNSFQTYRAFGFEGTEIAKDGRLDYDTDILAVDIETLPPEHRVIERISVSDGVRTHTLPWDETTREWLDRQIRNVRKYILIHNRSFDVPRLQAAGIHLSSEDNRLVDTMYWAVVIQPDLLKGLGAVASLYLDTYPWKWKFISESDPELYSALDAFKTARVFLDGLAPMAKGLRMWSLLTGEDYQWGPGIMPTIPVLTDMHESGIQINRAFAEEKSTELEGELFAKLCEWTNLFPLVDASSHKQITNLMYGEWKLPVIRTKKDGVTVNEFALVKNRLYIQTDYAKRRDDPWKSDPRCCPETFTLLLKIRELSKQLETYVTPALEAENRRIHPSYLPVGKFGTQDEADDAVRGNTATGRLATSRPNIQNQPKRLRNLYEPDYPDWCFVQFDYSRAEMWSMAAMANDDVMWGDLSEDPYQKIADAAGTDRDTAKNVVLAGQYLASANKVSEMILKQEHFYLAPATCKHILETIASRWTKRTAYSRLLVTRCAQKGWIRNPFGRIRIFANRSGPAAVNFIPQSIVADILWCVLLDVWKTARALRGRLTTTVHDSVLLQVPADRVGECVHLVKAIMERTFDCVRPGFSIPVSCEVGAPGAAWGELKKWDNRPTLIST